MERIYCDEVCRPTTEEATEYLVRVYNDYTIAKKYLDENEYKTFVFNCNNYIREGLNLSNKVFGIAKSEDNTQAQIVLFPKEPDGNHYIIGYDEELKNFYILAD